MATLVHEGPVRIPLTRFDAEHVPLSNPIVRDVLANNLCHAADQGGAQVRVAAGAITIGSKPYLETEVGETAGAWYHLTSFGPWSLPLRQGGDSYRLRVEVGGQSEAGASTVFALVLAPPDVTLARSRVEALEDSVYWTTATTATTPTVLTGASRGPAASPRLMKLGALEAERWRRRTAALASIGGARVGVEQALVALHVFGKTAVVGEEPQLHGLYAADYVGKD